MPVRAHTYGISMYLIQLASINANVVHGMWEVTVCTSSCLTRSCEHAQLRSFQLAKVKVAVCVAVLTCM